MGAVQVGQVRAQAVIKGSGGLRVSQVRAYVLMKGAGTPPERLETSVTVSFQPGEGIVKGAIEVVGTVSGIDRDAFVEHAEGAKENCPVSKALASVPEITLDARLSQ